jgi:hypothetical protein
MLSIYLADSEVFRYIPANHGSKMIFADQGVDPEYVILLCLNKFRFESPVSFIKSTLILSFSASREYS